MVNKRKQVWVGPGLVALGAWMAVLATLPPDRAGPGVTCDELYHALTSKRMIWAWERYGLGFFSRPVLDEVFPFRPHGPPAHPPLVHGIFGLVHRLLDPAPDNAQVVSISGARLGSALGYGLLVLLVGIGLARYEGPWTGTFAALALALMPRVFAHGHLAALEIWTALTLLAATLAVLHAELSDQASPRSEFRWLLAGGVWGLALLSRFHALLIGPVVLVWLLGRGKIRALVTLPFWKKVLLWTLSAAAVFYLGWPWLWYSTGEHLRLYLASATGRQPIHVYYLGRVWLDYQVPWHYPVVIFATTVPVGLLLLGLVGISAKRSTWAHQPHRSLWALLALAGLALFAWPGVPVYDGERLFLFVYPLWAIFVGTGCDWLRKKLSHWAHPFFPNRQKSENFASLQPLLEKGSGAFVLGLVALQGVAVLLYHPCQLSYYNLLVGGLSGADRLGLEVNYWGDAVREPILAEAAAKAPGQNVFLAPHLAPFQAPGIAVSSPALTKSQTTLIGWDPGGDGPKPPVRWLVLYHRKADLDVAAPLLNRATVIAEYRVQGVWLARLLRVAEPSRP